MDTTSGGSGGALRTRTRLETRSGRRATWLVLGGFVLVYGLLGANSISRRSATFDEPLHLAAGYEALVSRDYRIDPTHPPLARMWAALPLAAMDVRRVDRSAIDGSTDAEWLLRNVGVSRHFLYSQHDADRVLRAARVGTLILGAVLGCLIFVWAREWLGFWPAAGALGLYTVEPNLAGHATLVTTDLPVTCFIFAALYCLWRTTRRPTAVAGLGVVICVALAVATKFSGLLLAPILGIVVVTAASTRRSSFTWRHAAGLLAAVVVGTYAAVWAVYGFRYEPSPTAGWVFHLEATPLVDAHASWLAPFVAWIDGHHLLPNAFTQGAVVSIAASRTQAMYLFGQISTDGWWYYFPLAFLLKTPVALVALFAVGAWAVASRAASGGTLERLMFLGMPVVVVLVAGMLSGVNIGLRHVLPMFPFVILLAAMGGAHLWHARRRVPRAALAACAVMIAVQFGLSYPYTLTFFSRAVGGAGRGISYLADSNIDWGQHLNLVKAWMTREGVTHINLAYFGTGDPRYYGIDATMLPGTPQFDDVTIDKPALPGYVALSVNMLSGQYLPPEWRLYYRGFRDEKPVAILGNTIRVYWVTTWPETNLDADLEVTRALARALAGIRSYRHAAFHYRQILARRPNDARALGRLGVVLMQDGKIDEGLRSLRTASDLAPGDASIRFDHGLALVNAGRLRRAEVRAEAWVGLTPTDHRAHYLLAIVRSAQGRSDDARRELERTLEISPSFGPAREAMVRLGSED